ncbi:zinc/cadmium/mercury/lead-transporting ATPase [Vibrio sp. JC009]|uniref:zinc/cadmium/mercury/lead-transporting ATPase n=1 Tax=Vibrio sp. JC009 TaxID=2912314 RepID=UPI0023B06B6D|nr:zinc/cadmium/mercury/lead-transporting ATPase [Vibrio sp. JC009]WED20829.1 zinc/cadmium/mercury/lead-transporting ATPase [Vibrio sp. JC009]
MCTTHSSCHSKISVHKISGSCGCSSAPKITKLTADTTQSISCCESTKESCCSTTDDPGAEDPDPAPLSSETHTSPGLYKQSWKVEGMDCPSCAKKIETAVNKIDGVHQVKVLFATEKLVVDFDSQPIAEAIERTIIETGFSLAKEEKELASATKITPAQLLRQNYPVVLLAAGMGLAAAAEPLFPQLSHFSFIAICLSGLLPILKKAYQLAKSGTPFSIETLMSVAAIGALYLGESAEAAMVLLLFLLGEKLEAFASSRARSGVKALMQLLPEMATKIVAGERVEVSASAIIPGDIIEIRAGDRLPADGIIQTPASFDESALTGESVPVEKQAGEQVMAGSVVVDKLTRITVTSEQGENAVDRILHLIEDAESHKAPIERFLDRFSRWYTPAMMLVSLLVIVTPPLLFAQPWETWLYRGLALLLIACPCALVISTPAAITSGLAAAARKGILIKGGAVLEQLGSVQAIAFDKTGTLTKGKPRVTDVITLNGVSEEQLLISAASIETGSSHPLALAILNKAFEEKLTVPEAEQREHLAGAGVQGCLDGSHYLIVAPGKLPEPEKAEIEEHIFSLESEGKTLAVVVRDDKCIGIIAFRDELREEARATVSELKSQGIDCVMLTGDNQRSAAVIGSQIGIDYAAGLLPEDKVSHIRQLATEKNVAMVGDGINDAPAMKSASVGIAMGSGTDIALETADAALSHNRLDEVATMVRLSRATLANIRQNVALALGLKGIFLVTSILGITGLWVAVLADSGATVLVTLNALRLLRAR